MTTKASKPRGRPLKYTPETVTAITDALRLGLTRRDACVYGDISEETFSRWMDQHVDFVSAVEKAELHAKKSRVERIEKAGKRGTWQADAWLLERKYANEFGQRLYLKVSPEQDAVFKRHGVSASDIIEAAYLELAQRETVDKP